MQHYTRVITVKGTYFTRAFIKKRHHEDKLREISRDTVKKHFLDGNAEITVYFEESGKELVLSQFSDPESIRKYLGEDFLEY